jgi:hypothetical protein
MDHAMATDYTVIMMVRHRFGDSPAGTLGANGMDQDEFPIEHEAPFVGVSKDFDFSCQAVDRAAAGVLQFNALGVQNGTNIIRKYGIDIPGGISPGPAWHALTPHVPLWNTHTLLVDGSVLQEENILHIESTPDSNGNLDDFIIDNVVIWFKTHAAVRPPIVSAQF